MSMCYLWATFRPWRLLSMWMPVNALEPSMRRAGCVAPYAAGRNIHADCSYSDADSVRSALARPSMKLAPSSLGNVDGC